MKKELTNDDVVNIRVKNFQRRPSQEARVVLIMTDGSTKVTRWMWRMNKSGEGRSWKLIGGRYLDRQLYKKVQGEIIAKKAELDGKKSPSKQALHHAEGLEQRYQNTPGIYD